MLPPPRLPPGQPATLKLRHFRHAERYTGACLHEDLFGFGSNPYTDPVPAGDLMQFDNHLRIPNSEFKKAVEQLGLCAPLNYDHWIQVFTQAARLFLSFSLCTRILFVVVFGFALISALCESSERKAASSNMGFQASASPRLYLRKLYNENIDSRGAGDASIERHDAGSSCTDREC